MPPIRPCHPAPAIPPAWLPLPGPEAALGVVLAAASHPPRAETIGLALDGAHRGLACVVVAGTRRPEDIEEVAGFFEGAAEQQPGLGALVLATVRPGDGAAPSVDDERRWFDLRARFDAAGVELLDWFLLDGEVAVSLAEVTDSRWAWRSPAPRSA